MELTIPFSKDGCRVQWGDGGSQGSAYIREGVRKWLPFWHPKVSTTSHHLSQGESLQPQ